MARPSEPAAVQAAVDQEDSAREEVDRQAVSTGAAVTKKKAKIKRFVLSVSRAIVEHRLITKWKLLYRVTTHVAESFGVERPDVFPFVRDVIEREISSGNIIYTPRQPLRVKS
jgi:hypothetical protein